MDKIKELFKTSPKDPEIATMEKEITVKAEEINSTESIPAEVRAESKNIFGKIKEVFKSWKNSYAKAKEVNSGTETTSQQINKTDAKYDNAMELIKQ
jgi:hypothetical protein